MIRIAGKYRIAGLVFGFAVAGLAGGCASMDETAAVNPAATSDDVSAQRGWLTPGPRGVAPCPMEETMACAATPAPLAVNGGV